MLTLSFKGPGHLGWTLKCQIDWSKQSRKPCLLDCSWLHRWFSLDTWGCMHAHVIDHASWHVTSSLWFGCLHHWLWYMASVQMCCRPLYLNGWHTHSITSPAGYCKLTLGLPSTQDRPSPDLESSCQIQWRQLQTHVQRCCVALHKKDLPQLEEEVGFEWFKSVIKCTWGWASKVTLISQSKSCFRLACPLSNLDE